MKPTISRSHDTFLEYKHPRGFTLLCYVRAYGDGFKSIMVDCRRREYLEDGVRLHHWPDFKEHKTYTGAMRYVKKQGKEWQETHSPRRGDGTPFSRGMEL